MRIWKDYFRIEEVSTRTSTGLYDFEFFLVDIKNMVVVGKYRDYRYAVNRAKFKFKRMMKQIERTLLR